MKEDLKQLLLQDLSARLPYGVKVRIKATFVYENGTIRRVTEDKTLHLEDISDILDMYTSRELDELKPYLRPMSSMTEDEIKEWDIICVMMHNMPIESVSMALKFVNSKHLDYNNLIPKGLALPAPEGMYN